jgi:hypothetical protein
VEYLVGMGKVDARKFVLILDIDRLLGDVTLPAPAAPETDVSPDTERQTVCTEL